MLIAKAVLEKMHLVPERIIHLLSALAAISLFNAPNVLKIIKINLPVFRTQRVSLNMKVSWCHSSSGINFIVFLSKFIVIVHDTS